METDDRGTHKIKDRSAKLEKKRKRMVVNGQSMKRLLVDRQAKVQQGRIENGTG